MKKFAVSAISLFAAAMPAAAQPKVIASIMPVHSIVSAVMGDTGKPELIFSGTLSEHSASLTPQQIASLGSADLVFMTGPNIEFRLGQLSGTEAVNGKTFVQLALAPGVTRLPIREGAAWEKDTDQEEVPAAEGIAAYNGHVWLDPENAKAMAREVARGLAAADPANAATYRANAQTYTAAIDKTAAEIVAQLAPVKDKPFIVFHDAYPYFEKAFGLNDVGSIADQSANAPSARRIGEIRARLRETAAQCVFREPQFDQRFADTITEGTDATSGVLDAVGAEVKPGPGAYLTLLRNLAASAKACLSGN